MTSSSTMVEPPPAGISVGRSTTASWAATHKPALIGGGLVGVVGAYLLLRHRSSPSTTPTATPSVYELSPPPTGGYTGGYNSGFNGYGNAGSAPPGTTTSNPPPPNFQAPPTGTGSGDASSGSIAYDQAINSNADGSATGSVSSGTFANFGTFAGSGTPDVSAVAPNVTAAYENATNLYANQYGSQPTTYSYNTTLPTVNAATGQTISPGSPVVTAY